MKSDWRIDGYPSVRGGPCVKLIEILYTHTHTHKTQKSDDAYWLCGGNAYQTSDLNFIVVGKCKAVPLKAWSGPGGSRKLRFPDFMTTQDGGKVVSLTHWPTLPTGNAPGTHFC